MGLLDRFKPQPRWKHADAAIRLEAVRDLDDGIELEALAESDGDPKVRRAAVAHVADPACLGRIAAGDADPDVRERAADRLMALASQDAPPVPAADGEPGEADLDAQALAAVAAMRDGRRLSTVAKSEASEAVRTAALERVTDARALGSIARHARVEATATAALARLTEPADLLEVALRSDHRDVALAAFERLAASPLELGQLHSIEVRSQQKAVSRRARVMIQEIEQAEALRHAAALERQRRESMLHDAVLQLMDVSSTEAARADLARLTDAWAALAVTEPTSLERFAAAVEAADGAIARRQREAEDAREAARARTEAMATGVTLCARLETLDGDDCLAQLAPIEEEWRSLLPLVGTSPEADRLAERFATAVAACRTRHEMSGVLADARVRMDAIVAEAESLASREDAEAAAARWHALSREARGITALFADAGQAPGPETDYAARFAAVDHVFAEREAAKQAVAVEARRAAVAQVQRLIERTRRVADAETVTLREGERLMRDIGTSLDAAGRAAASPELDRAVAELRGLQVTVAPRVHELRQLDEWRRFANAQRQEQLITMAEAIVGSLEAEEEAGQPSDLAATARALRELHAEWQSVAEAPRQSAQRLWDRFRLATDFIRARCEGYFQQLREQHHAGLEKKTAIMTEAEGLATSSEWAKTAARLQELQNEWQAAPRVGRDAERGLNQRFRAACNAFFSRRREDLSDRKKVWTDNLARKEALCERAEALATSSEWDAAASEMKRLQADWKTIGPVRKAKSEVVWNRFRTAADRFFERYHSRHEIALAEKLSEREAIVVDLERLAAGGSGEQPDLAQQVQNVRATWHRSVPVPVPGMKELTDRWHVALSSILASRPDAFAGTDLDPAAVVQRMEKLVARAEALLADVDEPPASAASQTELLAARLRSALASNAMGGRTTDDSKWRSAGDAIKDAQSAWQRLPPVDGPEVRALEIRFREACRRISEQVRRHRQPNASQQPGSQGGRQGGGQQPPKAQENDQGQRRQPRREAQAV